LLGEAKAKKKYQNAKQSKMPTLEVNDFNIVCAVLGGFITVFGLVSYLFKERFYLSEACSYSPPLS
jgi:hypothetical protein